MSITFKDFILRSWLDIKMNFRYIFKISKKGNFSIPTNYKNIFSDDFQKLDKWDDPSKWGIPPYHPNFLYQWYDENQIKQTNNGVEFSSVINPKYFEEINTTIPNSIGILRTKDCWKYGIFTFSAKLPSGTYLWPAMWMSGRWNWPPEIDLLEAHSYNTNDNTLLSDIHVKYQNNVTSCSRTHRLPNKTTENFIEYVIWWEKDFVKIYYNGYLVKYVTDKNILDGLNEEQRIIIGNGTEVEFNKDNLTPLIINKIMIYQK